MSIEGLGGYRPENIEDPEQEALRDGSEDSPEEEEEEVRRVRPRISPETIASIQGTPTKSEAEAEPTSEDVESE